MRNTLPGLAIATVAFTGLSASPCHAQGRPAAAPAAAPALASAETTQIAEEAFIYGIPMVMGYGIMYEYAVDAKSSQYKAPWQRCRRAFSHRSLGRLPTSE